MSLQKYESQVHSLNYSVGTVYSVLSDFRSLRSLSALTEEGGALDALREKAGSDKAEKAAEAIRNMELTADTATFTAQPVGRVTLRIVEREESKLLKYAIEGIPVAAWMWIQLLPAEAGGARLKVTAGAEVSVFLKPMIGQYLSPLPDRIAGILAAIPYDKIK